MYKRIIIVFFSLFLLSICLAWVSSGMASLQGWGSFLVVSLLGAGLLWGVWLALQKESLPPWVGWLLIAAVVLRLLLGVFWFLALPRWGYGSPAEQAGFVMSDAYKRDTAAWELAQSDRHLLTAFDADRGVDQYGGLLWLSAAIYRYLGAQAHQPLLMVVFTAAFSSLTVLLTWAFSRRVWGERIAQLATWGVVLYPEAVLLGSSQMREAFTMAFTAAALYGLTLAWQEARWLGIGWMLGALLLSIPISPTSTFLLVVAVTILISSSQRGRRLLDWRMWLAASGLILMGLFGLWLFRDQLVPGGASNPVLLLQQWIEATAKWQANASARASGWMHKLFKQTSAELHMWILLAYGVVQPFLPAALVADGNWLWRVVAIWRSFGWAVLLPFLLYAPIRILRSGKISFELGASMVIWLAIVVASIRSGGDQWDNPRYRAVFMALQAGLASWVWVDHRRQPDPWLRRVVVGAGFVFLWFLPWYLRRYTPMTWTVVNVFKTLGLGLANAVLYLIWDWARAHPERHQP
jgi:hypothetical protein